jgi:hypothetical protein
MLTMEELGAFLRELGATKVLTVYAGARVTDPAMREAWRPALGAAARAARADLTSESERADFDRALAWSDDPTPPLGGVWGSPGWVAFLTAGGPRYAAELPVPVPTLAVWRDGPFVSPCVRALKQHRPVIVVLVDSQSARFYRYAQSALTALTDMTLSADDAGPPMPTAFARRGVSTPAPRGAVGTERATRRRRASFQRLAGSIGGRLLQLAGEDEWIVVGGTPEWSQLAGEALPKHLAERTMVSATLDHDAPDLAIARAAEGAASSLRAAHSRVLLDRLLERAGALGRGAAGVPDTQRALRAESVDLLLLSPGFLDAQPEQAEEAVRAALLRGAEVEVLSGEAAEYLDETAQGIAARLRFATDGPVRRRPGGSG